MAHHRARMLNSLALAVATLCSFPMTGLAGDSGGPLNKRAAKERIRKTGKRLSPRIRAGKPGLRAGQRMNKTDLRASKPGIRMNKAGIRMNKTRAPGGRFKPGLRMKPGIRMQQRVKPKQDTEAGLPGVRIHAPASNGQ